MLTITLNHLPPAEYSPNRSRGRAWQAKQRAAHGKRGAVDEIGALVNEQGWNHPPLERATVRITFGLPDRRRRDADGLQARMKPYFDSLVTAGVLRDDDLETIGWPIYQHEYTPRRPATTIEVLDATA